METENQKIEVNFLAHHGVTGQKWGERRYQNKDGSLTPLGRIHWGIGQARTAVSNKLKTRKSFRLETDSEKRKRLKLKAEKKEENKKLKLQKAEEAKQKKAEAIENKKAKLIAKGDKDAIYKNRELFSDEELDKAMARINKVNQFKTEKSSKAKEHLINRANPREIYANRGQLNDEELDRALKRVDKLKTVNPAEKKALEKLQQTKDNRQTAAKGKITLDKIASTGKTLVGIAGIAVSAYEAYNQIAANVNEIAGYEKWKTFKIRPWDDLMPKKGKSVEEKILDALNKQNKDNDSGDDNVKPKDSTSSSGKKNKNKDSNNSGNNRQSDSDGNVFSITKNNGYSTVNQKLDVDFGGKKPSYTTSTANTGDWASDASTTVGKQGLFNKTKAPNVFDVVNGLHTPDELKAIAKGKSEARESANTFYHVYSAMSKAANTPAYDLRSSVDVRSTTKAPSEFGVRYKQDSYTVTPSKYEVTAGTRDQGTWRIPQRGSQSLKYDNYSIVSDNFKSFLKNSNTTQIFKDAARNARIADDAINTYKKSANKEWDDYLSLAKQAGHSQQVIDANRKTFDATVGFQIGKLLEKSDAAHQTLNEAKAYPEKARKDHDHVLDLITKKSTSNVNIDEIVKRYENM